MNTILAMIAISILAVGLGIPIYFLGFKTTFHVPRWGYEPFWFFGIGWWLTLWYIACVWDILDDYGSQTHDPIKAVTKSYKARRITTGHFGNNDDDTHNTKELTALNIVEELALAYNFETPETYVIDDSKQYNAFAVGNNKKSAVILTKPLLENLNRAELSGVIGHELAHIGADDCKTVLIYSLFGAYLVSALIDYIKCEDCHDIKEYIYSELIGLALFIPTLVLASIIYNLKIGVSRTREFDADAISAKVNQDTTGLINALKKIEASNADISKPKRDLTNLLHAKYQSLYFDNGKTSVFDDHPSIKARIKRLEQQTI